MPDEEHSARLFHDSETPDITLFELRPGSDPADVDRLIGATTAPLGVIIESGWLETAWNAVIYLYEFSADLFACVGDGAGCSVSTIAVVPPNIRQVNNHWERLSSEGWN